MSWKLIKTNLIVLFVLLLLCEIGFRIVRPDYQYYERTYTAQFQDKAIHQLDTNWVKPDSTLGWVCQQKEQLKFYLPQHFDITYQINSQGFRNPVDFDSLENKSKKRILLLGDSFLFGIFLENEKTISSLLQKDLGTDYEIYNMAIPAWGIDQMYLAYQKYIEQIKPDQVVLFFIDDDIARVVEAFFWGTTTKQAYCLENDQLKKRTAYDGKLNFLEAFFLFQSKFLNQFYKIFTQRKAQPLAEHFIKKMIEAEKTKGRELLLFRCPRKEQLQNDNPFYNLNDFFEMNTHCYFDLKKSIELLPNQAQQNLYTKNDGHLSEAGAVFMKDILKKEILKQLYK